MSGDRGGYLLLVFAIVRARQVWLLLAHQLATEQQSTTRRMGEIATAEDARETLDYRNPQ